MRTTGPSRMLECGLLLAMLVWGPSALSQTFVVATDGSDTVGSGSAAAPWATITHALRNVPDGATIEVAPGTYSGRVRLVGRFASGVTVRSSVAYAARLRASGETVVTCFDCQGITLEGFDIAHAGPGAGALVIQIQDLIGPPGGAERTERIVLRDNVIHDSYDNDLLKINNGARDVTVSGNMFYNQSGSDEHIDINSVTDVIVQDNVFFNDFEGSGRSNGNDTSSFVVIKDSNGASDGIVGAERVTVRRNVFANWQGSTGSGFILVGEDGQPFYEAREVLVENNLLIGNAVNVMRAPFGVKGGRDVTFRHNTVVGDLPSLAYGMRLNREGANLPNDGIAFLNNIWSDPTGTMGAENPSRPNDFSDTPPGDNLAVGLLGNLYHNGGLPVPSDPGEQVNAGDDPAGIFGDPVLPPADLFVIPRLDPGGGSFADGSASIAEVFRRIVERHAVPGAGSAAVDAADAGSAAAEDILGRPRTDARPDAGAVEVIADALPDLGGTPLFGFTLSLGGSPGRVLLVALYLVRNRGAGPAPAYEVAVLGDGGTGVVELRRDTRPALAPGAAALGWAVVSLPDTAIGSELVLRLDPDDAIAEVREDDNVLTLEVPPPRR